MKIIYTRSEYNPGSEAINMTASYVKVTRISCKTKNDTIHVTNKNTYAPKHDLSTS